MPFVFEKEGLLFSKRRPPFLKRLQWFGKTTAVVPENDRSGFGKRPQWFWKTTAVVFGNDCSGFGKRLGGGGEWLGAESGM